EAAHTHVGRSLHSGVMEHSFRSAAPILQAVDAVFNTEGTAQAIGGPPRHAAFWEDLPGRVDLWPALETEKSATAQPWFAPIDAVSQESARFVLARQNADEVHRMIAEEMLPLRAKDGSIGARAILAGDFLILVQGRQDGLFDALAQTERNGLIFIGCSTKSGLEVILELLVGVFLSSQHTHILDGGVPGCVDG
ncbi:MAG: hypothetical protein GY824_03080, partial [Delftia sp.]|nr:hypothetical protein [Delftia sp.]